MFITLELEKNTTKGMIPFLRGILSKPKPQLEEARICGVNYWHIRCPLTADEPDWAAIEEIAGHLADRMLLPEGLQPPDSSPLGTAPCPGFEKKMLYETARSLVEGTRMPMYRRVLGLVDPKGKHTDLLPGLLKHFTSVRVLTQNYREYERAANRMMEELGAPVLVGDTLSFLSECVLILVLDKAILPTDGRLPCPVLAASAFVPPKNSEIFTAPLIQDPPALRGQSIPPGIPLHRLAAALHEWGGVDLGSYAPSKLLHNYRECTLEDASRVILQNAGYDSPF